MTDFCSTSVQALREPIISSSLLVKAENKHEHQKVSCFNHRKTSIHTIFKFKSTDLLSCLVCLSDKMADSALWLVSSPINQTPGERSIKCPKTLHYVHTYVYSFKVYHFHNRYSFIKKTLKQVFLTLALEVHFAAEFNHNFDQTYLPATF